MFSGMIEVGTSPPPRCRSLVIYWREPSVSLAFTFGQSLRSCGSLSLVLLPSPGTNDR